MKKAIIYLVEFIAIQLIGGFVVNTLWRLFGGTPDSPALLITTTCITGIVTIAFFLLTRAAEVSPTWLRTRPWITLFWCVIAAFGCMIPSVWLQEQMPELPNLAEQQLEMIMRSRWGYLAIGLLAPLSEELVLRGAVLRSLLQWPRLSPWGAIAISALFFAFVHFNPAQMPHAFLIGLLLGWMYYRTGSILPGVALHWVNNSIAYVLYNLYPNPQMKLIDLFGSHRTVAAAILFSLCILLPAIYQLHLRMKKADHSKQSLLQ